MSQATWYTGDALTVLKKLPDSSVDLVMTSPAFLALRSYLAADDPNKPLEMGSEATPGEYLDALLDVVEELRRVLAPHGSLVVELGDTYAGGGGWGDYPDAKNPKRTEFDTVRGGRRHLTDGWPLAKSLCMIPSSFAFALAYGRNPWTGRTLEPWRVRNLIAWCRPNPPVGALGDKFRPGTSYLTVACTGASRYFDLDAVREPLSDSPGNRYPQRVTERDVASKENPGANRKGGNVRTQTIDMRNSAGAPPLDWWEIPTHPYPGSHYATFPPALCIKPIKAMCPSRVCRVCGKPSERITERTQLHNGQEREDAHALYTRTRGEDQPRGDFGPMPEYVATSGAPSFSVAVETLGWSDCGHNDWRNGIVLDCFAGSGTTGEVATGHGRDFIGVDLDPCNLELARQRIGMFLTEAEVVRGG